MSENKHYDGKSLGQIVDDVADQYFAQGMDAYTAGKSALIFVLRTLIDTENAVIDFVERIFPKAVDKSE